MDHNAAESEPDTAGGASSAIFVYVLYLAATAGLWIATAKVRHGPGHYVLEALAIVFTGLATWAIGFVIIAFAKAARTVAARRRNSAS